MNRPRLHVMLLFVALVLAGGMTIGYLNTPGPWYANLEKPPFDPPNWLFGPVWAILYVLIGIAGARTWSRGTKSPAMAAWWVQLALNYVWSPLFFTHHAVLAAFGVILALLVTICVFIALTWRPDRVSALLFIPYALWVAFASLLNGSIHWLN